MYMAHVSVLNACRSPVTVGNWAIEKRFFYELGGLDTGMKLWGGENIDLPIRAVMAGGRHVNVPCAHAAHCALEGSKRYRSRHSPVKNYRRVVETLFSAKYRETFYYYNPLWQVRHKSVECSVAA